VPPAVARKILTYAFAGEVVNEVRSNRFGSNWIASCSERLGILLGLPWPPTSSLAPGVGAPKPPIAFRSQPHPGRVSDTRNPGERQPLVYLDNAATTRSPGRDRRARGTTTRRDANIHRGGPPPDQIATEAYEEAVRESLGS